MAQHRIIGGRSGRWSPYSLPRSDIGAWWSARNASSLNLTGSLVNSWTDMFGGVAPANTLTARPTYIADGLNGFPTLDFLGAQSLATASFATIPTGTNPSTIIVLGQSHLISGTRGRCVSYGTASTPRMLYVQGANHNIGVGCGGAGNQNFLAPGSLISGPFVGLAGVGVVGGNQHINVQYNGIDGGGIDATFNTTPTRFAIGASQEVSPTEFFVGRISEVIIVNRLLTTRELALFQWWLLDQYGLAFDVLDTSSPYHPVAPAPRVFAPQVAALIAQMTAAIGQPTINSSPPMVNPPVVTFSNNVSPPAGITIPCTWNLTPGMERFWGGWEQTQGVGARHCPSGIAGLIFGIPFLQNTMMRLEQAFTDTKITLSVPPSAQHWRGCFNGQYISRQGENSAADTRWITYDFTAHGGSAPRIGVFEAESSNSINGINLTTAGLVALTSAVPKIRTLVVLGDSFTASVGASRTFLGYVPWMADFLGFRNFFANGLTGTGWISRAQSTTYTAGLRVNDVTDKDTTFRNQLGAFGLTDPDLIIVLDGVNDGNFNYTSSQIEAAVNQYLDESTAVCPGVPQLIGGPWNSLAPAPYSAPLAQIDAGIQAACAGRPTVRYMDISGVAWEAVGGGNFHPDDLGHQQIGTALPPIIRAAMATF